MTVLQDRFNRICKFSMKIILKKLGEKDCGKSRKFAVNWNKYKFFL